MDLVTCPEVGCVYNGYGECHLGVVAGGLLAGTVTEAECPYFTPAREGAPDAGEGPEPGLRA